jgi:hypothetical protein
MKHDSPWLIHAESLLAKRHLKAAISCFNIAERKGANPARCAAGRSTALTLLAKIERAKQETDALRNPDFPLQKAA